MQIGVTLHVMWPDLTCDLPQPFWLSLTASMTASQILTDGWHFNEFFPFKRFWNYQKNLSQYFWQKTSSVVKLLILILTCVCVPLSTINLTPRNWVKGRVTCIVCSCEYSWVFYRKVLLSANQMPATYCEGIPSGVWSAFVRKSQVEFATTISTPRRTRALVGGNWSFLSGKEIQTI